MAEEPDAEKFVARNYQVQLMQIAVKQNTIIYLPTGSGKTFIALLVLKQLSESLNRPYSAGGKVTFILVNTVALVPQHAKYVFDHTILKVGRYTGEMNLDNWKLEEWEVELNKYQVFIMTSQILANMLASHFVDLKRVNLIIFDECHRGVDDQPMRQIMKFFQNIPVAQQPRVLGLTATLLNGNCKLNNVMDEVRALEVTYHGKVATVDGLQEVVGYSTNPQEDFKISNKAILTPEQETVIENLESAVQILEQCHFCSESSKTVLSDVLSPLETVDILKDVKNLIKDLVLHIEMLGTFGGHKACIAHMIQVERIKKHCQEPKMFSLLNFVITKIGWAKQLLQNSMEGFSEMEKITNFSSDKVLCLVNILKEFKTKSQEELCALIFVERRYTAKVLYHVIKCLSDAIGELNHIRPNFIVGNANNPFQETRENLYISKKNKEVLASFISKEINVLVSSNVLEEGVDIPKCTLVIKFDKCKDYRSYIQSKGRARHRLSLFYTIVEREGADKYYQKYGDFQRIETILNNYLVGKNEEREIPSQAEIGNMYSDPIPPFFVSGPESAQVSMLTSVALLCRYCSSLPTDQYTTFAPEWYVEKCDGKNRVVIVLPIICPILEPIEGPLMSTKKDAKRAAAFYACIALYKCGELDKFLLPLKKEIIEEDVSYLFNHWPKKKEDDAGFKKKKRLHKNQTAKCLRGNISEGKLLYLHIINLNPLYPKNEDDYNQQVVYDLCTSNLCFGLISAHPFPKLCKFPIYNSSGTIEVEVNANAATITLSEAQIMELREFHFMLFNDLLRILKPFLLFDNSGTDSDMLLVVPVQSTHLQIDFDLIAAHKTLKDAYLEPSHEERMNLDVCDDTYLHKIVSPWYRAHATTYVVTRVFIDKTPKTAFPNVDYKDFASYYKDRHSLKIANNLQPLLLVKGLSNRLNAFKPRGRESKRKKDRRYEELEEYLIPELVVKQEFPAALWVQAMYIPTILSRLIYLLKLKEFQTHLAREIHANPLYLENCPPLELDMHLLKYEAVENKPLEKEIPLTLDTHELLALDNTTPVTRKYNSDFAKKMLQDEYAWNEIDEPKDVEREFNITPLELEYYEQFVNKRVGGSERLLTNESPKKRLPAITYPNQFQEKTLQVLSVVFDRQIPDLATFYQALTAAEANDIVNLERLEILGDSFLKLASSLYVMFKFPKYNEGKSTALKGRMVSNRNLYYLAVQKNLGGILKNCDFSPKEDWVPPGFCLPRVLNELIDSKTFSINSVFYCNIQPEDQIKGVLNEDVYNEIQGEEHPISSDEENSYGTMCRFLNKQYVGDKTVADSVEALLGAFLQCGGIRGGIQFVEWIGIIPRSENLHNLIQTTNLNAAVDPDCTAQKINIHIPQWEEFEARLGYHFKNRAFLLQALTHSSYSPNRITYSYERLEFIGDAILDFLITCYIYEHCGVLNPGQVTDLRSALVNNNTFASLVVRYGFHKFLLMINIRLQDHIDKFADYLAAKDFVIDDEVIILLEEQDLNIAEYVDVPKVLGDIFEALAGAVYLDSGKDLQTVWKVFYKLMWKEINLFSKDVPRNVIRRLHECHTAFPRFSKARELDNKKTMVALEFMSDGRKKRVHGFGTNKVMAKRAAAKIALRSLGKGT